MTRAPTPAQISSVDEFSSIVDGLTRLHGSETLIAFEADPNIAAAAKMLLDLLSNGLYEGSTFFDFLQSAIASAPIEEVSRSKHSAKLFGKGDHPADASLASLPASAFSLPEKVEALGRLYDWNTRYDGMDWKTASVIVAGLRDHSLGSVVASILGLPDVYGAFYRDSAVLGWPALRDKICTAILRFETLQLQCTKESVGAFLVHPVAPRRVSRAASVASHSAHNLSPPKLLEPSAEGSSSAMPDHPVGSAPSESDGGLLTSFSMAETLVIPHSVRDKPPKEPKEKKKCSKKHPKGTTSSRHQGTADASDGVSVAIESGPTFAIAEDAPRSTVGASSAVSLPDAPRPVTVDTAAQTEEGIAPEDRLSTLEAITALTLYSLRSGFTDVAGSDMEVNEALRTTSAALSPILRSLETASADVLDRALKPWFDGLRPAPEGPFHDSDTEVLLKAVEAVRTVTNAFSQILALPPSVTPRSIIPPAVADCAVDTDDLPVAVGSRSGTPEPTPRGIAIDESYFAAPFASRPSAASVPEKQGSFGDTASAQHRPLCVAPPSREGTIDSSTPRADDAWDSLVGIGPNLFNVSHTLAVRFASLYRNGAFRMRLNASTMHTKPQGNEKISILNAQANICFACAQGFGDPSARSKRFLSFSSMSPSTPRFCYYTGKYFCGRCFSGKTAILPASVINLWDFTRSEVSDLAFDYLDAIRELHVFDLGALNPSLIESNEFVKEAVTLRWQIRLIRTVIVGDVAAAPSSPIAPSPASTPLLRSSMMSFPGVSSTVPTLCPLGEALYAAELSLSAIVGREDSFKPVEYPVVSLSDPDLSLALQHVAAKSSKVFSLSNLVALSQKLPRQEYMGVLTIIRDRVVAHVMACDLCRIRGASRCSLCTVDEFIYAWDVQSVALCARCKAPCHLFCLTQTGSSICGTCEDNTPVLGQSMRLDAASEGPWLLKT